MKTVTLIFPVRDGRILLGLKKRGFGEGKIMGFGGKLNSGESVEEAAVRELLEEAGIDTPIDSLTRVAEVNYYFPHSDWGDFIAHVFTIDNWKGEPQESEEMRFEWHDLDSIPYDKMWDDAKHWVPEILKGRKVKGKFSFGKDNSTIDAQEIVDLS